MTLTKNARKICINDKKYKWKVGTLYRDGDFIYIKVYVETPFGNVKEFEECMGTTDIGVKYPVTPDTVRNIILMYNL